ncbi:DsrE family protein [Sulfurovum sp. CS9]|uniref:DsrE family protein n=1 Tax=Sulfurovum sp. CS9 TaxID=3391146 RepID=UPI0039ED83B6
MKLGIVIYSHDPETVWNAFRLGVFSLKKSDEVKVFLLAKGVECESLDIEKFSITKEMSLFVESGGEILACGTCLKIRQSKGSDMCPMSTMEDLHQIISESDKVVTF